MALDSVLDFHSGVSQYAQELYKSRKIGALHIKYILSL